MRNNPHPLKHFEIFERHSYFRFLVIRQESAYRKLGTGAHLSGTPLFIPPAYSQDLIDVTHFS
jgi:hypothetical protein